MEIIPAIDIIDGKCVRLSKGDFDKKSVYHNDPLEVAKQFESAGIRRLHIVDLDGASGKSLYNLSVLETISSQTMLVADFGGGIQTDDHLHSVFNAGAAMVSVGSVIVKNPAIFSEWVIKFGPEKFLPGADVLDKKIRISGWKEDTGIELFDFIESLRQKKIKQVFCTDISKDGMMQGPAVILYKEILKKFPDLYLIASGGISCLEDLITLKKAGCKGAITGKAIYENRITLKQIEEFNKNRDAV
jgi:phosphoribosylformimino-5-aminoimidazole carboxamide ribotide isomerase